MNVISMMHEINTIANPVIGESALPDLLIAANDASDLMGVCTFDQLDGPFNGHVARWGQQQMNMFGHDDELVQGITAFAAVSIERRQKHACVDFDDEQFPAVVRCESHEIGSRRGDESYRLQRQTSAAESRASIRSLNWHEWNSCPSQWIFLQQVSFWERPIEFQVVDTSLIPPRPRKYDAAK